MQWKSGVAGEGSDLPVNFQVLDAGKAASGAEVVVRGIIASDGLELARGAADSTGAVQLSIPFNRGCPQPRRGHGAGDAAGKISDPEVQSQKIRVSQNA